ncbi:MAG TPA: HEAT repeat domain-containing protein [Opitutaceae bacterium]|nr:HEAT repeat domain-containing protein [Opitutaceae bacterium]
MPALRRLRLLGCCTLLLFGFAQRTFAAEPTGPAGNEAVQKIIDTFGGRGVQRDDSQPLPPAEALKKFTLRDGLAIDLIASEPAISQPLYVSFDSRGRLWVTQYIQYQYPAGLKVMSYDQHLRAVFDKVPEPPPRGVKGADKITVLEDKDGDGTFESQRDVITGLNIATAAIKGAGGIWVLNAPYLLFYPDANDDDVPDGDPKVCLSGFGLEDTHSVANSLLLGPDGWVYGAVGSTTTGNVSSRVTKNVRFVGQHIWRYHPKTEVFEIFGEGGGNTFSCEIDAQGRVFSGTNGNRRGMHYDQGMAGEKNFGKHGSPLNPYAFGYFEHMATKSDGKRFSQAFCVYDGGLMTADLGGKIVAPNSLQNMVYVSRRVPDTSTFRAEDDAPLLSSSDRWFRPVDVKVGPDGAIYMADWYDTRLSHVRPVDDWSKKDGRIYRVRPAAASMQHERFDLHTAPAAALLKYLGHDNKWFRRQAALELYWRDEKSVVPALERLVRDQANVHAFDAVSALALLGGLRDELAVELLQHPDPYVRRWVVRMAGDDGDVSPALAAAIKNLAAREEHVEVRTQMAATARRVPAPAALPIVRALMDRDADQQDKRMPLMLWWALETKAETDRGALLGLFEDRAAWQRPLARNFGARHLAQRWAMAGGKENYDACAKLLALAPKEEDRALVVEGLAAAFEGGRIPQLPPALSTALTAHLARKLDTDLALAVKTGNADAVKKALIVIKDEKAPLANRVALVQAFADAGNREVVPTLLTVLNRAASPTVRQALLPVAAKFDDASLASAVIKGYEARFSQTDGLRDAAHRMLASRVDWAKAFLEEIDRWQIRARDVAPDIVRQLELYHVPDMDRLIRKHWGAAGVKLGSQEKLAELQRIKRVLAGTTGDAARGKAIFTQRCAACHALFDEGGHVGPNLTGYERSHPDFWLVAILDPSAEIREGFNAYTARLKDGQTLMGMLVQQDAGNVVLRDMAGQSHTARVNQIEKLEALPQSLMPEGLLGGLDDAALKDLFAYLMKP